MDQMEMRERRWEELDVSCLALIFARLGIDDKVLSIPFVCKSWHRASLDPLCWRSLNFASLSFYSRDSFATRFKSQYPTRLFEFSGLLKHALRRSQGSTTELFLPGSTRSTRSTTERFFPWQLSNDDMLLFGCDGYSDDDYATDDIFEEDLKLVEKECLRIETFSFAPILDWKLEDRIPKMVANWENLETLEVRGNVCCLEETLTAIKEHCPRFRCLRMAHMHFREDKIRVVVALLPTLKHLSLYVSWNHTDKKIILDGCIELEKVPIEYCRGAYLHRAILVLR